MIPVKRFYMIRHGETVANAEGYASGSMDTPLTEKGREQARSMAPVLELLETLPVVIVHSALSRARDTARLLNMTLGLPMQECALLGEQSFGDWVGTAWSEVARHLAAGDDPPNGETRQDFVQRVMRGLAETLALPQEPVLIVTHGGVFDALMIHYEMAPMAVKNCHLYEFVPEPDGAPFPWAIWHYDKDEKDHSVRKMVKGACTT